MKDVAAKKKGFKLIWKKAPKASFYQVRYTKKSTYEDYDWTEAKVVKAGKKATGPYVDLYRSNRDGSDAKKIESFYYDPENEMLFLMNFRSKSCDVYDSSGIHKYTYKS